MLINSKNSFFKRGCFLFLYFLQYINCFFEIYRNIMLIIYLNKNVSRWNKKDFGINGKMVSLKLIKK